MSDDKDPMTPADFRDLFPTARPARLQQVINQRDALIRDLQQQLEEEREAQDIHVRLLEQQLKTVREALEWYGEQARLCRLIHSGGDPGRHALSADGGQRAAAAIRPLGKEGGRDA